MIFTPDLQSEFMELEELNQLDRWPEEGEEAEEIQVEEDVNLEDSLPF